MAKTRAIRSYNGEALEVITAAGDRYKLPVAWGLDGAGSVSLRNKLEDRAYAHGGDMVGDGKVDGRTVDVSFYMRALTEEEHDNNVNEAYKYFAKADYKLMAGREDRVYNVAGISKIKHSFLKSYKQRASEITVTLLLADPFRYATQQSVKTFYFKEAQELVDVIINNPGSVDAPLIINFAPIDSMADITLLHVESGQSFTIKDTLLTCPSTTTVNAEDGTIRRGESNSINTFSGQFLHCLPGKNTYRYTGGAGTIAIKYTARYFV